MRNEKEIKKKLRELEDMDLPFPDDSIPIAEKKAKIEILSWVLEKIEY